MWLVPFENSSGQCFVAPYGLVRLNMALFEAGHF
jgi:hypothetical protein